MRILALVPGEIGDQILFFPTIDDLKKRYPEAQIDVVVEPRAKEAYRVSKSVNEVIAFDFQARNSLADWGNLLGTVRDREYEAAITLDNRWSVGFLLWLSGIPNRVGFAGGAGELFLTRSIPYKGNQYLAQTYHDLVQGMDLSTPLPNFKVSVPAKDLQWADQERQRLGLASGGYVVVCGDAKSADGVYPADNWRLILQDFQKKQPELPLVLAQTSEDESWVKLLVEALPGLKITAPDNLGQLVAMLTGASLVMCLNSDTMHLSIASQAFTLVLLGQADPNKLLPKNDRVLSIKSSTGQVADIAPSTVLEKVWGG